MDDFIDYCYIPVKIYCISYLQYIVSRTNKDGFALTQYVVFECFPLTDTRNLSAEVTITHVPGEW